MLISICPIQINNRSPLSQNLQVSPPQGTEYHLGPNQSTSLGCETTQIPTKPSLDGSVISPPPFVLGVWA